MTDQPTPQTEAGRRLVAAYHVDRLMVIAIENEAQARTEALDVDAALDAAAERVRALITKTDDPYCCVPRTEDAIAAILAAKAVR